MIDSDAIIQSLKAIANPSFAEKTQLYFKTGPGEYAHGHRFLGIPVPVLRRLLKDYRATSLASIDQCLSNDYHEVRLFALLLLVDRFKRADHDEQSQIVQLYLNNTNQVNNWSLVDSSAPYIVGAFLYDKDRQILHQLAKSTSLWERRIAMVSTFFFIKRDDYQDCLQLAETLLGDSEDLMHKAVGWMLREIGKRNKDVATGFLKIHYQKMPRTMLRYAIERYPEHERQAYLKGTRQD